MTQTTSVKGLWLGLFVLWTGVVIFIGWSEFKDQQQLVLKLAAAEAAGSFNKDLVYRRWVARQGGVYVIASDYTKPSSYLDHVPHNNIVTKEGLHLTLVNPAYMTRQVHELSAQQYGAQGHITSLNPLRPENAPDSWERVCLMQMEQNQTECVSVGDIDGESYLRLMRPMYTESPCLKCHSHQGYELGDVRGGISVSIPLTPYNLAQKELQLSNLLHLTVLWILGSILLMILRFVIQRRLKREDEVQKKIALSEAKYRLLFDESMVGFAIAELDSGTLVDCNRYLAKMVDRDSHELIGQSQKILHPVDLENEMPYSPSFTEHRDGESGDIKRTQLITKDGEIKDVEVQASFITLEGIRYMYGLFIDVTERIEYEQQSNRLKQAIDQSPICVVMLSLTGQPVYVNQCFEDRTGYTLEECCNIENPISKYIENKIEIFQDVDGRHRTSEPWLEERQIRSKSGELFWERTTLSPVYDLEKKITHYLVIGEDITEEKKNALQFEFLATHDSLTGLANRLLLGDRLEQSILKAKRLHSEVYLILLDVDRFKIINDTMGHDSGDLLLQKIAERLESTICELGTVVRFGGDEFVVLLDEIDSRKKALDVVESIHSALSVPFDVKERQLSISVSAGISSYPDHGMTSAQLLRYADVAMYKAKEGSAKTCVFEPCMDDVLIESLEIEAELRQAIANKELQVYYQPKVEPDSERIVGLEALLRWIHPHKGMISPALFIPIAEQSGLILEIGLWVVETVCRQINNWQKDNVYMVPVAVNLSAVQFQSLDLASQVETLLKTYQVDTKWFEFELTESMIMNNPLSSIRIMNELKKLGIRLAVDDFGTGYSSLNYLRRLPLDYLKIDRSFIDDVTLDASADAVATSIIGIARSLGMETIAEGVETVEQLNFLKDNQCDLIQGFYFYKPMPADEIKTLLVALDSVPTE